MISLLLKFLILQIPWSDSLSVRVWRGARSRILLDGILTFLRRSPYVLVVLGASWVLET